MDKEAYNGLVVTFVPMDGASIITASGCQIISVGYYVGQSGWSECNTEGDHADDPELGEYSYNWDRVPPYAQGS